MIAAVFIATSFLLVLGLGFAWAEALTQARSEQRHGPNRLDDIGLLQFLADAYKVMRKSRHESVRPFWLLWFVAVFPFLLVIIALAIAPELKEAQASLLILLAAILTGLGFRARASVYTENMHHNFSGKETLLMGVIGWLVFFACATTVIINAGTAGLSEIYLVQQAFPFANIFRSPALFVAGVVGFFSLPYMAELFPLQSRYPKNSGQREANLIYWSQRFWIVGAIIIWSLIFTGGWQLSVLGLLYFIARILVASLLMIWLQLAFARLRTEDALGFAFRRLLPLAMFCIIFEAAWLVMREGNK